MAGDTVLGSNSGSHTLTVNAATALTSAVTASAAVTVAGTLTALGSTVLGSSSSSTGSVTVNSPAVFVAPVQVQKQLNVPDGALLNVSGNAILGSDSRDSIVINGATVFKSAVAFQGTVVFPNGTNVVATSDTTLGTDSQDLLTVNALALFSADVQVDNELYVDSLLTVARDAVFGNSSKDHLTVNAAATFLGPADFRSLSTTPARPSVIRFSRRLGNAPVTTGTVLGSMLFTGYDGATDGSTAQIRSIYTVGPWAHTPPAVTSNISHCHCPTSMPVASVRCAGVQTGCCYPRNRS